MLEDVMDQGRSDHELQRLAGDFPYLANMVSGHLSQGKHVVPMEQIFQGIVMSSVVPVIAKEQ